MNEFITFAQNHLFMLSVWIVLLTAVVIVEILNKKKRPLQLSSQALVEIINADQAKIIDIRTAQNFRQGHILHSKNIPWLGQDENAFTPFQKEAVVLICQQGQQASKLADKLQSQGFEQIKVLEGGITTWMNDNLPLVKGK